MIEHRSHIYGVIGEFEKPEQLVHAAAKIREAGYRYYESYTPFPVEGLPEAMGMRRNMVPLITLIGGLVGGFGIVQVNPGRKVEHALGLETPAQVLDDKDVAILGKLLE